MVNVIEIRTSFPPFKIDNKFIVFRVPCCTLMTISSILDMFIFMSRPSTGAMSDKLLFSDRENHWFFDKLIYLHQRNWRFQPELIKNSVLYSI